MPGLIQRMHHLDCPLQHFASLFACKNCSRKLWRRRESALSFLILLHKLLPGMVAKDKILQASSNEYPVEGLRVLVLCFQLGVDFLAVDHRAHPVVYFLEV